MGNSAETRDPEFVERENHSLRLRVAELQRRLARYSNPEATARFAGLEVSISEREELLSEAERSAHVGSWIYNTETDEVFWSDELYRIFGYDPDLDVASTDAFFAAVHPEDRARVREHTASSVANAVAEQIDCRVLRRDGSVRQVTMDAALLFDERGKLRRMVGTVLDLTDALRLHERLAHAEKMEAVGRLAGGIAHDFNNLLMVVRGNLDLLEADGHPAMRAVLEALESARSLTDALLAFGRKSHLRKRPIDLNGLVATTLQLLGRVLGEQITLCSELSPDAPCAEIDAALFQQVLVNLALNARDALENRGTITVRTRAVVEAGRRFAEIAVEDDGPGMDDATKGRLFEPFFTTKLGKGTGLGLAMVHGTVAQHDGTIRVDAEPGRGTRFTIRIPASDAPAEAHAFPLAEAQASAKTSARSTTVLVVEDHVPVANTLSRMLQRSGCQVLLAAKPSTALELFAKHRDRIDLALCDLVMPEMHGTALVAELRRSLPSLPVVFMSGSRGEVESLPAAARLLGKPFTMAQLIEAVASALGAA